MTHAFNTYNIYGFNTIASVAVCSVCIYWGCPWRLESKCHTWDTGEAVHSVVNSMQPWVGVRMSLFLTVCLRFANQMSTAEDEEEAEEEEETGKNRKNKLCVQVLFTILSHSSNNVNIAADHFLRPQPKTDFRTTGCRSEATKSQIKVKVA